MSRITPTGREVPFLVREMFYSETNTQGVIRSSNEIFERVSGYPAGILIGKPHNIIRHPDMPRSLFQVFWRSLHAGQPISAYVKNMAANGDHYWVLATAFPCPDGFVSIRIKATTEFLPNVSKIYAETLLIEKAEGLERGEAFLLAQLRTLGFDDYKIFTVAALNAEISARRQALAESKQESLDVPSSFEAIERIRIASKQMSIDYGAVTEHIAPMLELQQRIGRAAHQIVADYREIKFIAVNMMVNVEKSGDEARTLSVIAKTFKTYSEDILHAVIKLQEAVKSIKDTTSSASFIIASARMQVEMLAFFLSELTEKMEKIPDYDSKSELELFTRLCRDALLSAKFQMDEMRKTVNEAKPWLTSLAEAIATLYFVQQNGKMEIAHLDQGDDMFTPQFKAMNSFMNTAKSEGQLISQLISELNNEGSSLMDGIVGIEEKLPF